MSRRPGVDSYYMGIAEAVSLRANCRKRAVGAVVVNHGVIVSTGYNGTPRGWDNCLDDGCPRCLDKDATGGKDYALCFCCHAEENAIVNAARNGATVKGGVMYSLLSPCLPCARMIVNAGLTGLVYRERWDKGAAALGVLKACRVLVRTAG